MPIFQRRLAHNAAAAALCTAEMASVLSNVRLVTAWRVKRSAADCAATQLSLRRRTGVVCLVATAPG